MNEECAEKFYKLRNALFAEIRECLKVDGHCKHYEGRFHLIWPCYFEDDYAVTLDCYLVGPHRGETWRGKTLFRALEAAERDIMRWIEESQECRADQ